MAKVTVCIPTYNRAGYLRESMQSVLAQTMGDLELLVCDNASTDDTAQVVQSFHDPRIRYFRQPTNIGIGGNHQTATAMAQSEFVAVLSDDDLYTPEHLAVALAALNDYPAVAYYTCALERFGNGTSGVWHPAGLVENPAPIQYLAPQRAVDFLGRENPGFLNTMVCRKDRFSDSLYWGKPGYVHMDMLVMTQLMIQGGCLYGAQPTVRYRNHESNISHGTSQPNYHTKLLCMLWYGVRYLAQLLLDTKTCTAADLEQHGLAIPALNYAANYVFSLGSYGSSPTLYAVGKQVFRARTDVDSISKRFRLARKFGYGVLPMLEQASQVKCGWRP